MAQDIKQEITGEFCFQFDDDEPEIIEVVFDNDRCSLHVQQTAEKPLSSIEFFKNGKKFKIFIRPKS